MFARISRRYDLMNSIISAGRHHAWRRMAAAAAVAGLEGQALDVAAGTGDFTFELARFPSVSRAIGLDFTGDMLSVALQKTERRRLSLKVRFMAGDAHHLPFPDGTFACATVGFGVRNFIDIPRALREMVRVLKPGGRMVILEIVPLEGWGPLKWLFPSVFRRVTPLIGGVVAGDREAYTYLPDSVQHFHTASGLAELMGAAGLANVGYRRMAFGTVVIHAGEKPE